MTDVMTKTPAGRLNRNGTASEPLPEVFCWTKYGVESGEAVAGIFDRKESERLRNGGVFLWGIGNSLRPSIMDLVHANPSPIVCFSPMKSRPAQKDVDPSELELWDSGRGLDGKPFRLPEHSVVTSRVGGRRSHFALVCRKETPIIDNSRQDARIFVDGLRNHRSGTVLGSSQVTSIVRQVPTEFNSGLSYPIGFTADLVPPYFVELTNAVPVPREIHKALVVGNGLFESLLSLRRERFAGWAEDTLF